MIEVKIIEDLQAPLHIGAGRLPDWLRHKRRLLALDKYADELCIFRCIAVHQGAHGVPNTRKTRELAASFLDKHRVRGRIYKSHFSLIENHFQQGLAGYEINAEGAFALKYLLSRFDKIRRARFVDHEARQSDEILCMCRMSSKIHQKTPFAAACRGFYERSV